MGFCFCFVVVVCLGVWGLLNVLALIRMNVGDVSTRACRHAATLRGRWQIQLLTSTLRGRWQIQLLTSTLRGK